MDLSTACFNFSRVINPVPVEFVCKVVGYFLSKDSTTDVDYYNVGSLEHIKVKVIEIVKRLKEIFDFQYIFEGEEKQPVCFITKTEKLAQMGLASYDVLGNIIKYIQSIVEQGNQG